MGALNFSTLASEKLGRFLALIAYRFVNTQNNCLVELSMRRSERRWSWQVSLPCILIVPFIVQVVTIGGWVGYISHRHSQRSVADLTTQLINAASKQVEQKLTSYLVNAQLANQINSAALRRGDLKLDLRRR